MKIRTKRILATVSALSLKEIGDSPFSFCDALSLIEYAGSADDFTKIKTGEDDYELLHREFAYNFVQKIISDDTIKPEIRALSEVKGDVNCDGEVNIADLTLIKGWILNSEKYSVSEQGLKNADLYSNDGVNSNDIILIQKMILNIKTDFLQY